MSPAKGQSILRNLRFVAAFLGLFWLAHALGYFVHEYAHSFTAWAFGYKANPLALNYGHLDWNNMLTQGDVDENVDYDPIFAAGRGPVASLIAIAGVLFGNGISYLVSLYGYRKAKRAGKFMLALFFFLFGIMNVGNLISYIPARTFATHADMATVEQGLNLSPWWLAIVLGIPFCVAAAHFILKIVPVAMRYFFPDSRAEQAILLALSCYMIFVFYGGGGLHRYGSISHAISMTFIWLMLPLAALYGWISTRSTGNNSALA